jgi:hypothetical protein
VERFCYEFKAAERTCSIMNGKTAMNGARRDAMTAIFNVPRLIRTFYGLV